MKRKTEQNIPVSAANLSQHLKRLDFTLTDVQVEQLLVYIMLLQKWNKVMNLVGPEYWQDIVNSLILDSLYLADFLNRVQLPKNPLCWDFGSGAGLPGIPLRIMWQNGSYYMVDVREKRVLFMQTVLSQITLPRTQVLNARVEEFMEKSTPADLLISRAFMPWQQMLTRMQGRLAPNGQVLIMGLEPNPKLTPELAECWQQVAVHEYTLPIAENRTRYFRLYRAL